MEKYVRDSYTEQVQILSQSSLNGYKRLFGGRLMEWIDVVAGVVARRHSNRNVTTAAVDNLRFEGPAYGNETIVLCGTSPTQDAPRWRYACAPMWRSSTATSAYQRGLPGDGGPGRKRASGGGAPAGADHRGGAPGMGSRPGAHPYPQGTAESGKSPALLKCVKKCPAVGRGTFFHGFTAFKRSSS